TSEEFLRSIDAGKFDAAIVAVGSNTQVSIMATVLLKELKVKFVLVKAKDDFEEKILYKIGADKVILPEKDMGIKVARNLAAANFYDMIEISSEYSITSAAAPESWYGKSLGELGARARYGTNILGIKNNGETNIMPNANTVIERGSVLIILGTNSDIKKFASVK
ncbi:MAG: TrkA family potassium uptake protein, partial [Clostridiales bacterium]|nr:TrkA family potassium uptake protein [Clostridiales bacterium]